ncbi:hypothetical protein PR202_gb28744 [Eleusine coracana subsp. coracana]|uniref:F-box domain-containing protein n=1 Tax=Eleusine coracana subsp. coracana TaxID=191504 RepID=A0AAV5FVA4_ELECO|nr:hypothetical protein PR202_gb28744 [Eleusine coracana subsp. coracana]
MAPPPPPLAEEIIEEILIRFPPDDPASLLGAALVCKPWCRLVCSPVFRHRFTEFHRRTTPPPVLGFFCCVSKPRSASKDIHFIPTSPSFRRLPHAIMPNWRAVDALHGRVLFCDMDTSVDELLRLIPPTAPPPFVWSLSPQSMGSPMPASTHRSSTRGECQSSPYSSPRVSAYPEDALLA